LTKEIAKDQVSIKSNNSSIDCRNQPEMVICNRK